MGETLSTLVDQLQGYHGQRSTVINDIAEKYKIVVTQCKPELTRDEWLSMCAAYNGHMFGDMLHEVRAMAWMAAEWIKNAPTEAGQFDTSELVAKIDALNPAERIAVLHYVAIFWGDGNGHNFEMFD